MTMGMIMMVMVTATIIGNNLFLRYLIIGIVVVLWSWWDLKKTKRIRQTPHKTIANQSTPPVKGPQINKEPPKMTLPTLTDAAANQRAQLIGYLQDAPKIYRYVSEWLFFDSQRYYDMPSQLFQQICLFGSESLTGTSIYQDPLVAVKIYENDPNSIRTLVKLTKDGKLQTHSQALVNLNPQNTDAENKRILGTFTYELIAEKLLTDGLDIPIANYQRSKIGWKILKHLS